MPVAVRNIYCVGRNYAEHARELGNPVPKEDPIIFLKSSAALRGLDGELAFADETFSHEVELVLLVGQYVPLGGLVPNREQECLSGLGLGLDLTRRAKQTKLKNAGHPWTVSKSFSGSAVVSPMARLAGDLAAADFDFSSVHFDFWLDGELRQQGYASDMIFDVPLLLRHLNEHTPLLPGDLIFTGTPKGVGEIRRGQEFKMSFLKPESLATLKVGGGCRAPFRGVL